MKDNIPDRFNGSVNPTIKSQKSSNVKDWELMETLIDKTFLEGMTANELSTEIALTEQETKQRLQKCQNSGLVNNGIVDNGTFWYVTDKGFEYFKSFVIDDLDLKKRMGRDELEICFPEFTLLIDNIDEEAGIQERKVREAPAPSNCGVTIRRPVYQRKISTFTGEDDFDQTFYEWSHGHHPGYTLRRILVLRQISQKYWREFMSEVALSPDILDVTYKQLRNKPKLDALLMRYRTG